MTKTCTLKQRSVCDIFAFSQDFSTVIVGTG